MHSDRKHERKAFSYPGWIGIVGSPLVQCLIDDASEGGARLRVKDPASVPNHFRLLLSPIATTSRECLVRWRKAGAVGVQFVNASAGTVQRR